MQAAFTRTPPVIDGRLDDAAWQEAAVVDDLHMVEPDEYAPPSERSVIYVLYGSDALYFGARFYDSEPGAITARVLRQGDVSFGEDGFSVMLDPFDQGQGGYIFDLNPNGVRSEALYTEVTEEDWDWTGIWRGAAHRDDAGWTAEMAIPFKTLSFDPRNATWGINFTRWLGRRNERFGWVSHNRTQNPAIMGELVGLAGIEPGRGLDVVPALRSGERRERGVAADTFLEPSLDVFYKPTPALTAALTLNTDFSGTTADTREINLTRFDLFFPEQRQFFLSDADIFAFGRIGDENGLPFFSRRIGLSDEGEPVDIDVGGKLTGRVGGFDLGLLGVSQDAVIGPGSSELLVVRAAAHVLAESALGMIVTRGDPEGTRDNSLLGVDFRYLNTRLSADRTVVAAAWYQRTQTDGLEGDDAAFGLSFELPGRRGLQIEGGWKEIQENFYPALGFVNETGVREERLEVGWLWRPTDSFVRSLESKIELERMERIGGGLVSQALELAFFEAENQAADVLEINTRIHREHLTEPFEISDGVVIPAGDYEFTQLCAELATGEHRVLAVVSEACDGEFYEGELLGAAADLVWRPSAHFRLGAGFEWNDVDLPQGEFTTRLARLKADVAFTSTWYWENLLQYDNVSESLGINSILRWVPEAGREALLVVNRVLEDPDGNDRYASVYREITLKVSYTFRF